MLVVMFQRGLACLFSALKSVGVHGVHSLVNREWHAANVSYRMLGFVSADPSILTVAHQRTSVVIRTI